MDQSDSDWQAALDEANLPFQPLSLAFSHINNFVDMPKVNCLRASSFHGI